jgi:hypothetical protein
MTDQEERVVDPKTGGTKGRKTCEIGALDPLGIIELGKVAGFGTRKYDRGNFMRGYDWSLSYDALQRHLHCFWSGEDLDLNEKGETDTNHSGLHHLAHAAWHCLTLLAFSMRKLGNDNRYPKIK